MRFIEIFEAINVLTDDLLTAIAKAGGLNTQEAIAQGIDPEDIKTAYVLGIKRVFTKTGRSFDAMAEYLSQHGYPVTDEKGHYSGNVLLNVLDDALRGKRIHSVHGGEADFERQYAAMAHQYEHKRPLDAILSETVFKIIKSSIGRDDTIVYKNPSNLEFKRILAPISSRDAYVFGTQKHLPFIILENGDCLFWTGAHFHWDIYKHFSDWGIDDKAFLPCRGVLNGRDLEVYSTDSINHTTFKNTDARELEEFVKNNKYLNAHFRLAVNFTDARDLGDMFEYDWQVANGGVYYNELEDEDELGEEGDLNETILSSFRMVTGDEEDPDIVVCYLNPSSLELKKLIAASQFVDVVPFIILGDGKVLFWTPGVFHCYVINAFKEMGITAAQKEGFIPCRGCVEGRDIAIEVTDSCEQSSALHKPDTAKKILTNKYLKEQFHIDPKISYHDEAIVGKWEDLKESAALMEAYDFMATFNPILNLPSLPPGDKKYLTEQLSKDIREAKTELKRQDRITWYLRFIKYKYATMLEKSATLKSVRHKDEPDRKLAETDKNKLREIIAKLESQNANGTLSTGYILEQLKHYLSLPIASIQNYIFTDQKFTDITAVFSEAEKEWAETRVGAVAHSDLDVFLQLPDDYAWYDLKTAGSREEADAMGHCGNMPCSSDPDQTILSLRHTETLDEKKVFRICLTFVLHKSTGMLGEMKGRANTKPAKKYHQYIIPLLEDPRIKGIAGGTWEVKENFTVFDLPEAEVKRLLLEKPALAPLGEYIEHYGLDSYVTGKVAFIFKPIPASHIEFHGEKFKYKMWNSVDIFAKTQEGNRQFMWMYNHISGDEPIDIEINWIPDPDALEGMFNKENEKKFLADAKKAWGKEIADENKDGDEDKDEIDIDNLKSVLEYMEEHQEDAYQEILNCYHNANDGATSDAIYKSFMDDLKTGEIDTEEVLANVINVDGSTDQAKLENVRIELDGIENMDDPVWVIFDLAEFLKDVAASEPNFNQIDGIGAYIGDLKMDEPRNGYEPDYRNLIEIFNKLLDEMWGEIFK